MFPLIIDIAFMTVSFSAGLFVGYGARAMISQRRHVKARSRATWLAEDLYHRLQPTCQQKPVSRLSRKYRSPTKKCHCPVSVVMRRAWKKASFAENAGAEGTA